MTALSEVDALRVRGLRAAGYRPFPMIHKKQPATKWKRLQDADADDTEFEGWLSEYEMFAVICGAATNLVVIDADSSEAVDYVASQGLQVTYRTTRGAHFWIEHPGAHLIVRQSVGTNGGSLAKLIQRDDVDVRGDKSIAVAVGGDRTWAT